MYGEAGNDRVFGLKDDDVLQGGQGNDRVAGDEGNDYLAGQLGSDFVFGLAGSDAMYGGGLIPGSGIQAGAQDFCNGGYPFPGDYDQYFDCSH